MNAALETAAIGTTVAEHSYGPVRREDLRRYAQASGDSNPLHLDPAFAAQAGLDDVIVHGMLGMALLGRLLDEHVTTQGLIAFRAKFRRIIRIDRALLCRARLSGRGPGTAILSLEMLDPAAAVLIEGSATISIGGSQ